MVVGGLGRYPLFFTPLICTIPASWLAFLLLYFVVRPQFQLGNGRRGRFFATIHVHNLLYVGAAAFQLYTMAFRDMDANGQRVLAILIPVSPPNNIYTREIGFSLIFP